MSSVIVLIVWLLTAFGPALLVGRTVKQFWLAVVIGMLAALAVQVIVGIAVAMLLTHPVVGADVLSLWLLLAIDFCVSFACCRFARQSADT